MHYRRDIDGLRAVAVLLVIAFHAFPNWVRGGFVGVDVFFVISGFLISGIIFRKLINGTFSFSEFYYHRIRRIFPALILVLAACLGFGVVVMTAPELAPLGKHVFAASGFFSNFTLKGEAGYFDTATALKPLLHLWSLGVEEQFYIFWPLLLFLAWRLRVSFLKCLVVFGAISFLLNLLRIHRFPDEVFYLPHTRIWELMIGAFLAYLALPGTPFSQSVNKLQKIPADLKTAVGIGMIAIAALLLEKATLFPGYAALLPTVGAFLVISAGQDSWLNRTFLGSRALVGIGLISYPLYLWHWPIFSFLRIMQYTGPQFILAGTGLSFILAWLTYEWLEKRIRHSERSLSLLLAMLMVGSLGYYSFAKNGVLNERLKITRDAYESFQNKTPKELISNKYCIPDLQKQGKDPFTCLADSREKPRFILMGDSQSNSLFPGLVARSQPGERWVSVAALGTMFLDGIVWTNEDYNRKYERAIQSLADSDASLIFMVNAIHILEEPYLTRPGIDSDASVKSLVEGFSGTIDRFEKAGKQVVFMLPTPEPNIPILDCIIQRPLRKTPNCSITIQEHEKRLASLKPMYAELQRRHPNLLIYDPTPLLCPGGVCSILVNGKPIFKDDVHVSEYGAELIAQNFMDWLHSQARLKQNRL